MVKLEKEAAPVDRLGMLLYSSELLLLWIVLAWGVQLLVVGTAVLIEPVSHALLETFPYMPVQAHGLLLAGCCVAHMAAICSARRDIRRYCIFAQFLFFVYAFTALVQARLPVPGMFICVVYASCAVLNWFSLLRVRAEVGNAR